MPCRAVAFCPPPTPQSAPSSLALPSSFASGSPQSPSISTFCAPCHPSSPSASPFPLPFSYPLFLPLTVPFLFFSITPCPSAMPLQQPGSSYPRPGACPSLLS